MSVKPSSANFLHYFQTLCFGIEGSSDSQRVSKQADNLRGVLTQINYAIQTDLVSEECGALLIDSYYKKYSTLVDSPAEQNGLNNYADSALNLAKNSGNKSNLWESGLTESDLLQHPMIKEALCASSDPPIFSQDAVTNFITEMKRPSAIIPELQHEFGNSLMQMSNRPQQTFTRPPNEIPGNKGLSQNPIQYPQTITSAGSNQMPGRYPGTFTKEEQDRQSYPQNTSSWGNDRPNPSVGYFTNSVQQKNFEEPPGPSAKSWNFTGGSKPQKMPVPELTKPNAGNGNSSFLTARQQLVINQKTQQTRGGGKACPQMQPALKTALYGTAKKSLGARRAGVYTPFVPPVRNPETNDDSYQNNNSSESMEIEDERLKGIDPKMIELIKNEIMDHGPPVSWNDIAGLEFAKKTIQEIVVWPLLRPDIFTGLRGPPKGILLFGPPGTGKTLIGKCIASQSKSTFFSISASSLTSKWIGEGEKMVRTLFAVARCHQPAVIFIDEIDSLLTQRSDTEHESSRRIKTEFLVHLDGCTTSSEDRLLLVGATNRPQELDEAARRRLVKRLYIPLPENPARRQIVVNLLCNQKHDLTSSDVDTICEQTEGYSGADMTNLCREAALGPIRSIDFSDIEHIKVDQVRPILPTDFTAALAQVRPSVADSDLRLYEDWNRRYGSSAT